MSKEVLTQTQIANNSLGTLRKLLFEQMLSLRNGETEANEAIAMSKVSHQIIESFKVEIQAVQVANSLKDKNLKLESNIKVFE